jgi:hypothetical protein
MRCRICSAGGASVLSGIFRYLTFILKPDYHTAAACTATLGCNKQEPGARMVKDDNGTSMLAGMVVSVVKGRMHCRSPYLRKPETARFLEKFAASLPGMREVIVNTTVGSVLFAYEPVGQVFCSSV